MDDVWHGENRDAEVIAAFRETVIRHGVGPEEMLQNLQVLGEIADLGIKPGDLLAWVNERRAELIEKARIMADFEAMVDRMSSTEGSFIAAGLRAKELPEDEVRARMLRMGFKPEDWGDK